MVQELLYCFPRQMSEYRQHTGAAMGYMDTWYTGEQKTQDKKVQPPSRPLAYVFPNALLYGVYDFNISHIIRAMIASTTRSKVLDNLYLPRPPATSALSALDATETLRSPSFAGGEGARPSSALAAPTPIAGAATLTAAGAAVVRVLVPSARFARCSWFSIRRFLRTGRTRMTNAYDRRTTFRLHGPLLAPTRCLACSSVCCSACCAADRPRTEREPGVP